MASIAPVRQQGMVRHVYEEADFGVELCDPTGRGLFNLGYVTFDSAGRMHKDWRTAKVAIKSEQRRCLWQPILAALEHLLVQVAPDRIQRTVRPDAIGQRRDVDVHALLLRLGYAVSKSFNLGEQFVRVYSKD